jgi:glycosyltransferase involved in cell wall biosynthesis
MTRTKLSVVCPSAFDNLGHPEYAENITRELISEFNCFVDLYSKDYRGSDNYINLFNKGILTVHYLKADFMGFRDSLYIKQKFLKIFGNFGLPLFKIFSFITYIKFYLNFFKKYKYNYKFQKKQIKKNTVLHLEFEPLSYTICNIFFKIKSKNIFVLHNVNFEHSNFIFNLYKKITLFLIKKALNEGAKLIVHSPMALDRLVNLNISHRKIIIGGWGHGPIVPKQQKSVNNTINCLAFGVVRNDKRIKELVELFALANDSRLKLIIAGKFVDYPSSLISTAIKKNKTQTKFLILDRYLDNVEVENFYADADISILSHDMNFNSSSGPLFKSIECAVPILCFSFNDVREIVLSEKIGIVENLELFDYSKLFELCRKVKKISIHKDTFYSWKNISSRIYHGINT